MTTTNYNSGGARTVQRFDAENNLISEIFYNADGSYTKISYNDEVKIIAEYDKDDKLKSETIQYANGNKIETYFNKT